MDSTDKLELIHSEKGTQLDPLQLGFTLSSLCLPRINSCCLTTGRLRIRTWSYFFVIDQSGELASLVIADQMLDHILPVWVDVSRH